MGMPPLLWCLFAYVLILDYRVATVREKIFFQDHGKVMEFCYKSVKMSFFEKVRENQSCSGNFLFFILIFSFVLKTFIL